MNIQQAIQNMTKNIHLTETQMKAVMHSIMQGETTNAQIGAFLMGLRLKGETIEEITAAAQVMRELAIHVKPENTEHLIDIVGTGGDGQNLFNVSTASSFVISSAGATVAKHGNRGVSSNSGSSDLLEKAGIQLNLSMDQTERCLNEMGIGFLFAPNHHKAMKYAIAPRKELGIRTIFNLLGPLTNPAGVQRLVVGVFSEELCLPIAEVLKNLGAIHVMVVHSKDGLDEISLATQTTVAELKDGEIKTWQISPEHVGIQAQALNGLSVNSSQDSLKLIKDALGRKKSDLGQKAADMIALNAGAGIYVSGLAKDYAQGVAFAQDIIDGGQALEKMSVFAEYTKTLKLVESTTE